MSFRQLKDAAIANALQAAVNSRIHFGKVTAFALDSASKTVSLKVALAGESEEVSITLHDYKIEPDGPNWVVSLGRITSSKEWVERAARQFVAQPSLTIPPKYGWLLEKLI